MRPSHRALCLLSVVAAACARDEPRAPIATVRDSAGVEIVENRWAPGEVAEGWAVEAAPLVEIGVLEGDEALQLFRVAGGALLADGRIALVNAGTREVRIFSPDGAPDTVFGGDGDGPGEFREPQLADARGDTLIVYDLTLRRATVWHPERGIVREFGVGGEGGGFPVPQGAFEDGSIVFGGGMSFSSQTGFPSGLIRQSSTFASVSPTGGDGAVFGEFPASEMFARVSGGGFSARSIPFGRITNAAVGDSTFYVGTQDAWEIRAYDTSGRLRRLVRVDRQALPVGADLRARFIDEALAQAEDEAERRRMRQTFDEIPFGDFVPPYGSLAVDALGHLWVSDAALPGEDVTGWSIFAPEGTLVGRLDLPAGARLLDIRADRLLARITDDLGVERVRLLRLHRPAA